MMTTQTKERRKVAIYGRVSTNGERQDCETQLRELREHCSQRGWAIAKVYEEHMSGTKASRPALNKLMADAQARKFNTVLVWKLDRFGRSLQHLANTVADLDKYGVAFLSLTNSFDRSTPEGRAMFGMLSVFAEYEVAMIRERVKSGLRNARAKGKRLGRPAVLTIDIEDVRQRQEKGESLRTIGPSLGCTATYLCRLLKKS
jgi:DNA invertase Pin-like site-specific DNA recombinase